METRLERKEFEEVGGYSPRPAPDQTRLNGGSSSSSSSGNSQPPGNDPGSSLNRVGVENSMVSSYSPRPAVLQD